MNKGQLSLLLLFALQAAAAIEPPPDRGKWVAVGADNLHVFSNAGPFEADWGSNPRPPA